MRFIYLCLFLCVFLTTSESFALSTYQETLNKPVFPEHLESPKTTLFIFDPSNLQWAVYDTNGNRIGLGKAVGGKDFCPDINKPCRTVEGSYTVFRAGDHDCTSKTFPIDEGGGAPMPHCVFFYKGYAIHGSDHLPDYNASHGCIRVRKQAAEWISNYINVGSTVVVLPYLDSKTNKA